MIFYAGSLIDMFSILVDLLCNANLIVRTTNEKRDSSHQTVFNIKPYLIFSLAGFCLTMRSYLKKIGWVNFTLVRSQKTNDIIWEFFPTWGGGLPKSQNFCKFTKYFFVCQIGPKMAPNGQKHVILIIWDHFGPS